MSKEVQRYSKSVRRVTYNEELGEHAYDLLAQALVQLNQYNRGEANFAYFSMAEPPRYWCNKLVKDGFCRKVRDRKGNFLGVELTPHVGVPKAVLAVRMGRCPEHLASDPRNTIDPNTGEQLIEDDHDEQESVCQAMTPECETGYSYSLGKRAPKFAPAAETKQAEAEPQVVTPRQQTELRLCGLSEAEVTSLLDESEQQQADIDKLRKLVDKLRVSHSLVDEFRKRIVELTSQVDAFEVSEGQLVGKLENAEEELQDMARAYANGNALRAVEFEQKLKAKEQELVDINREAYATDACLQAILREFPSIKLPKKARIDAAMVEYINTQDALDLEELARKHSITLSELQTAAADLKSKPAAKPTRKRKLATAN